MLNAVYGITDLSQEEIDHLNTIAQRIGLESFAYDQTFSLCYELTWGGLMYEQEYLPFDIIYKHMSKEYAITDISSLEDKAFFVKEQHKEFDVKVAVQNRKNTQSLIDQYGIDHVEIYTIEYFKKIATKVKDLLPNAYGTTLLSLGKWSGDNGPIISLIKRPKFNNKKKIIVKKGKKRLVEMKEFEFIVTAYDKEYLFKIETLKNIIAHNNNIVAAFIDPESYVHKNTLMIHEIVKYFLEIEKDHETITLFTHFG